MWCVYANTADAVDETFEVYGSLWVEDRLSLEGAPGEQYYTWYTDLCC